MLIEACQASKLPKESFVRESNNLVPFFAPGEGLLASDTPKKTAPATGAKPARAASKKSKGKKGADHAAKSLDYTRHSDSEETQAGDDVASATLSRRNSHTASPVPNSPASVKFAGSSVAPPPASALPIPYGLLGGPADRGSAMLKGLLSLSGRSPQ
jgi:hypothetical protein